MSKDKQKSNTQNFDVTKLSELIKNGYALLKTPQLRKELGNSLDEAFVLKQGWKHWKYRFLYPERNIPQKHFAEISSAMVDMLMFYLQKETDLINEEIKLNQERIRKINLANDEKIELISKAMKMINDYKNE